MEMRLDLCTDKMHQRRKNTANYPEHQAIDERKKTQTHKNPYKRCAIHPMQSINYTFTVYLN